MDMQQFVQNRQRFPAEELEKHIGKYIAWSPDGLSILASADDELRLDETLRAAGHNPAEIVVSFLSNPDEIILGGGGFSA